MATKRNALGRGLGALLPTAPREEAASGGEALVALPGADGSNAARVSVSPDEISPNPDQPRRVFDEAEIERLAKSIQQHGVLQPVVVRRASPGAERPYELVVGERRWRAAQRAGLEEIPVTIQDVDSRALLEIALVENVQRRDLNAIELAHAFRALHEAGATQEEVGRRVGLDRSTVANHLRLLELPSEFQQDVEEGTLTTGHAKALLQVSNPERRRQLRDRILSEGISVRAAEAQARSGAEPSARKRRSPRAAKLDPNLQQLVDSLRDHLQTQVRISGAAARGRIEVEFYGPEELHRLSRLILEGKTGW
jgi:ParB family chromosome partitioning protein